MTRGNPDTAKLMWAIGAILFLLTLLFTRAAENGYGYMGYRGYHVGPSWWYWHRSSIYYDRNIRGSSVSGSSMRGRGPGSGK